MNVGQVVHATLQGHNGVPAVTATDKEALNLGGTGHPVLKGAIVRGTIGLHAVRRQHDPGTTSDRADHRVSVGHGRQTTAPNAHKVNGPIVLKGALNADLNVDHNGTKGRKVSETVLLQNPARDLRKARAQPHRITPPCPANCSVRTLPSPKKKKGRKRAVSWVGSARSNRAKVVRSRQPFGTHCDLLLLEHMLRKRPISPYLPP